MFVKVEKCTFEVYEVYAVDVAMTTGEGRPKEQGTRTTVFKRLVDMKYGLKVVINTLNNFRDKYFL